MLFKNTHVVKNDSTFWAFRSAYVGKSFTIPVYFFYTPLANLDKAFLKLYALEVTFEGNALLKATMSVSI